MNLKKNTLKKILFTTLLLPLMACGSADDSTASGGTGDSSGTDSSGTESNWFEEEFRCETAPTIQWSDVNDWHYQLQNADYKALAATKFDLMVLDSEPPDQSIKPNKNITERLKCDGDGEKLLVSYMAIGQAESYRYFYQDDWEPGNPSWLFAEDEFWPGDFYVRYWDPEWKAILMGSPESRVDRIVAAGFDGIYLDTVDAYTFFIDENPDAIVEMQTLVREVSDYARMISGNPDFGVFVQNAEELIDPDFHFGPIWAEPLTGIGKEEPFFYAMDDRVPDSYRMEANDRYLGQWKAEGKLVMNVDYVTTDANIDEVYELGRAKGYIPLALSDKALDRIQINPGHEPD